MSIASEMCPAEVQACKLSWDPHLLGSKNTLCSRRFVACRLPQSLSCTVSTRTGALSLSCAPSNSGSASDDLKTHQTCATCQHSTVMQPVRINTAELGHHRIAQTLETALRQQQDHSQGTHGSRTVGSLASEASLQGDSSIATFCAHQEYSANRALEM